MAYLTRTPTQIVGPFGACPFGACSDIYPPDVPAPPGGSAPFIPEISLSVPAVPGAPAPELPELYPPRGLPWWAWLAIGIVLARAFQRS